MIIVGILFRGKFFADTSSSDNYFVNTRLFLSWMTRRNCNLNHNSNTFSVTIRLVLILFFVIFLIVNDYRGCLRRSDSFKFIHSNACACLPSLYLDETIFTMIFLLTLEVFLAKVAFWWYQVVRAYHDDEDQSVFFRLLILVNFFHDYASSRNDLDW